MKEPRLVRSICPITGCPGEIRPVQDSGLITTVRFHLANPKLDAFQCTRCNTIILVDFSKGDSAEWVYDPHDYPNGNRPFWQCRSCNFIDSEKAPPKDPETFRANPTPEVCPHCKLFSFVPRFYSQKDSTE